MPQTHTPETAPHSSILWRVITQAVILAAFIIVILTTVSFVVSRTMLERSVNAQLSSVAAVAEDSLEAALQRHRERASLLSAHADVSAVLEGTAEDDVIGRLMAGLRRDEHSLLSMEIYGADGVLLASAGDPIGLPREALSVPVYRPVVTDDGWEFYDVFTPVWAQGGGKTGIIAMRYNAFSVVASLLNVVPTIGQTADALFVEQTGAGWGIIHPSADGADSYVLSLGKGSLQKDSAIAASSDGQEGVGRFQDHRGHDTLAGYRYLPALGWGLVIQVDRSEALAGVRRLALSHATIGGLILLLAAFLAYLLASQLTAPLRQLTDKVRTLRPGHWGIRQTVRTGDEVEVLDRVAVDMASRLQKVYEHLEDEIDARTKELRRQFELDGAILQTIDYGVVTVGKDGIVTTLNPAAQRLLNLGDQNPVGSRAEEILLLRGHKGEQLKGAHPIAEAIASDKSVRSPANTHLNLEMKDGTFLPVMFSVSPLHEGSAVSGAIVVFQDITEERKLDYLKSEFITLASHQLRTPLSALRWYVELFNEEKKHLTEEQQSYLDEMTRAIERMVALLGSLLNTAKLEDNDVKPEFKKTDIRQLMNELMQDCQSLMNGSRQQCALSAPGEPVYAMTDPTLLRIVLQNLLSNAAKYSRKEGGSTGTVQLSLTEEDGQACIGVQDCGLGIPKEEQDRVFQKFFRAKNVRKMDTDGNGLGLYISRSIVERLGGTIAFTSEENKGSTFTVRVPREGVK